MAAAFRAFRCTSSSVTLSRMLTGSSVLKSPEFLENASPTVNTAIALAFSDIIFYQWFNRRLKSFEDKMGRKIDRLGHTIGGKIDRLGYTIGEMDHTLKQVEDNR